MFVNSFKKQIALFIALSCTTLAAQAISMNGLLRQAGDPVSGNPNGKVTMVEFSDYQCSHCISMHPVVKTLIQDNPDLRVVYKMLPIRGAISLAATQAALAAQMQGKFTKFNNALINSASSLSESRIYELAKSSGLDVNKLKKDMKSSAVKKLIDKNMKLAREIGLKGTPTFYFAKTNAQSFSDVNSVLGSVKLRSLQNAVNAAKH